MAVLQALLAFVGRSAGKILNALFGWAVRALFGAPSGSQAAFLTILVAAAALWPLLALGVAFPRVATFALAFVPIPESVSTAALRSAWIAFALVVPLALGIAVAAKAPPGSPREPFALRALRGFPLTFAIAIAFGMSFVTVPLRRLASILRGLDETHVTLITSGAVYEEAALQLQRALNAHGFGLQRTRASFWSRAPLDVLRALGGKAMRGYVPERLAHFVAPDLEATLHPSSLLLRGRDGRIALAQGLVVEALAPCDALQTTHPEAQDLERQIRRIWRVLRSHPAHRDSVRLAGRLRGVAHDLGELPIAYEDWETVYRQLLQLARALHGEPQLLSGSSELEGADLMHAMNPAQRNEWERRGNPAAELSTGDLLREIASKATLLAAKEVELARLEMKRDFDAMLGSVKSFAVAAVFAITTLNLLLVAGCLALAATTTLTGWGAALVVAGATLVIAVVAASIGWRKRPTQPLERTRRSLKEDIRWAKEATA